MSLEFQEEFRDDLCNNLSLARKNISILIE